MASEWANGCRKAPFQNSEPPSSAVLSRRHSCLSSGAPKPVAGIRSFHASGRQSSRRSRPFASKRPRPNQDCTSPHAIVPLRTRTRSRRWSPASALFDYDGDGFLDIYLVNGAEIPSLEKTSPDYWNRLFHNNGDGTFTDVTEKAGVAGAGYGMGVAVGDYDNDGRPDLFLASVTGNQLLHNNGDGTFTDVTAKAGVAGARFNGKKMWSVSAGWFDYNNDGLLDLFVVNYCQWEVNKDPYCPLKEGLRAYCHPNQYHPLHNTLYRNNGDGTFTDVSLETGIAAALGKGMSVSFADYDGDGYPGRLRGERHHAQFPLSQHRRQAV